MKRTFFSVVIFACFVCALAEVQACSLAVHDWKLAFYIKIPVSNPFFPLAEFNLLHANFKNPPTDQILWKSEHNWISHFLSGMVNALPGWPGNAHWLLTTDNKSVLSIARDSTKSGKTPIILGSDLNFVKIAVFSDANSDFNCHQIVFLTTSRVRGVFTDHSNPWAQEITSMAWVSLIFYQFPYPGRVLSFSVFPFNSARYSIFEDHELVRKLLAFKLLKRRADLEIDPYVFDFPELPE